MDAWETLGIVVTILVVSNSVLSTQAVDDTCSLDDIKVCFLPVRASGLDNWLSEDGLQRLCPMIQQAFDCVDETCALDDNWEEMEKVSYGIRNLEDRICNDTDFRLSFLQHGDCFRSASIKFKECIVAFNHSQLLEAGCCENLGLVTCYEAILIPECPDASEFIEEMIRVVKEKTYSFCQDNNLVEDCPSFPEAEEGDITTTLESQDEEPTSQTEASTVTEAVPSTLIEQPSTSTEPHLNDPLVDQPSSDVDPLLLDHPSSFDDPFLVDQPSPAVDPELPDQPPSTVPIVDETTTINIFPPVFNDEASLTDPPSHFADETFNINDD